MNFRHRVRELVNPLLKRANVRAVHADWGPRGFLPALARLRNLGVVPQTIVDVGAARGEWTRECAQIYPDATYWMFDPLAENGDALAAVSRDGIAARSMITALGSDDGMLQLNVHGDQTSAFSSEYEKRGTHRTVQLTTLDSVAHAQGMPQPGLIKADVQGYELEVLRGARRCLENCELVLLEVSFRAVFQGCPLADEVIATMSGWGFRIYDICSYAQRPRDRELFQADILFASKGSRAFAFEGYE